MSGLIDNSYFLQYMDEMYIALIRVTYRFVEMLTQVQNVTSRGTDLHSALYSEITFGLIFSNALLSYDIFSSYFLLTCWSGCYCCIGDQ